jgi:phage gp45-like
MPGHGRDREPSLDNVQFSPVYGTVTQNKDPEKMGRIKVRFEHHDNGDIDQSNWAQVVTPMEGDKYGWYVLPDVGDVVVVMFIGGDIHQPVILGGVWSKPDPSPEPNEDGKNNFRGYRSRTGHRLILDDSSKPKIVIADKTGKNTIGIGSFEKDGAGPNVCAVYKPPMSGTTGVSFSTLEGNIEITCKDGKLSITAEEAIKLNIIEKCEIMAGKDVSFEGKSKASMTSGSESSYQGSKMNLNSGS